MKKLNFHVCSQSWHVRLRNYETMYLLVESFNLLLIFILFHFQAESCVAIEFLLPHIAKPSLQECKITQSIFRRNALPWKWNLSGEDNDWLLVTKHGIFIKELILGIQNMNLIPYLLIKSFRKSLILMWLWFLSY